jgi:putative membrane protein
MFFKATSNMKNSKIDRQREHQANERTFLAWLRTSIALIGFGFAIARFGLFLHQLQLDLIQQPSQNHSLLNSESLGVTLVVFGIVIIALAAWQYNRVYRQIERGDYRPNRWLVGMVTVVVIVIGVLSLPLLLGRERQERSVPSVPRGVGGDLKERLRQR